jgi:hypothetical protein
MNNFLSMTRVPTSDELKKMLVDSPSTTINVKGKPYLTRYFLAGEDRNRALDLIQTLEPEPFIVDDGNIYVHNFHSSDQITELHNHPWEWGISFMISGGYWEEYVTNHVEGTPLETRDRLIEPGGVNVILPTYFHRVDLLDEIAGAWSLFIAGPRRKDWGFLDRNTGRFTHYTQNPEAIP